MPCDSQYMNHTGEEKESGRVLEFLKEISGEKFDHENPSYYGHVATLNEDTAKLCAWCRANDVSRMSLELQLWWKRHQQHDKEREEREAADRHREHLRKKAIAKLSEAEAIALGLIK